MICYKVVYKDPSGNYHSSNKGINNYTPICQLYSKELENVPLIPNSRMFVMPTQKDAEEWFYTHLVGEDKFELWEVECQDVIEVLPAKIGAFGYNVIWDYLNAQIRAGGCIVYTEDFPVPNLDAPKVLEKTLGCTSLKYIRTVKEL